MIKKNPFSVFVFLLIAFSLLLCPLCRAAAEAPVITAQPDNVSADSHTEVSFAVEASGKNLAFQWYRRISAQSPWEPWQGAISDTLYLYTEAGMDGWQFRCTVTGTDGSAVSEAATLTVAPYIYSWSYIWEKTSGEIKTYTRYKSLYQDEDQDAVIQGEIGDRVTYSVQAEGSGLSYQWQYREDSLHPWLPILGETNDTLQLTLSEEWHGKYINREVTAANGLTDSPDLRKSNKLVPYIRIGSMMTNNPENIAESYDLYYLTDDDAKLISIPPSLAQQLDMSGHTLRILTGTSTELSDGIIRPKPITTYSYQLDNGFWVTASEPTGRPDEVVRSTYEAGDTVYRVDNSYNIRVSVHSYAVSYAESVMDEYLRLNIRENMNEYEKAEVCCRFVASYDYGTDSSSYTGMILTGSGDCWASTFALMYMTRKLGLNTQSHDAGYIDGAGGQHMNVIAKLDGLYYILEAGYEGEAPRAYSMDAYGTPFSYTRFYHAETGSDGIVITAYMNIENVTEIEVPGFIDGLPVIVIGDGAFQCLNDITRVSLPDSIERIGKEAFYQNFALREINMPSSLREIGLNAFTYCTSLEIVELPRNLELFEANPFLYCDSLRAIHTAPGNTHFKSIDGVLYSADGTELLIFPTSRSGAFTVPAGVTRIGGWAFAGSGDSCDDGPLTVALPDGLLDIEPYAFYSASLERLTIPGSVKTIQSYAFMDNSINTILLSEGIERIEDGAFYRGDSCAITFPHSLKSIGMMAFAGDLTLTRIHIPDSVTEIGDGAFQLAYGWSSMGGGTISPESLIVFDRNSDITLGSSVFSGAVLGVYEGTASHRYAVSNEVRFLLLDEHGKAALDSSWFTAFSGTRSYMGTPLTPSCSVNTKTAPLKLQENSDYTVSYVNNEAPGTGSAVITGIGSFTGTVTLDFEIKFGSLYITFSANGGKTNLFSGKTTAYGEKIGMLAEAYRPSDLDAPGQPVWEFLGWFTERDAGEQITEDTVLTFPANKTLYAHWLLHRDLTGDGKIDIDDYIFGKLGKTPERVYRLPSSLRVIYPEAFLNDTAEVIFIPASVSDIAENALPKGALIVLENDTLSPWMMKHGFDYLIDRY